MSDAVVEQDARQSPPKRIGDYIQAEIDMYRTQITALEQALGEVLPVAWFGVTKAEKDGMRDVPARLERATALLPPEKE